MRCWGFEGDNPNYVICTRDNYAGQLKFDIKVMGFTHFMPDNGKYCDCGLVHGDDYEPLPLMSHKMPQGKIDYSELARQLWSESITGLQNPGGLYLRNRGIALADEHPEALSSLRYNSAMLHTPTMQYIPALVGQVTNLEGNTTAISRIYINPNTNHKADVPSNKMSLGLCRGNSVKFTALTPSLEPNTIAVCEGIETGLSILDSYGSPSVWVALGSSNLPLLEFPDYINEVHIYADGDSAGYEAMIRLNDRLHDEDIRVRCFPAPIGKDWADVHEEGVNNARS
jgi:hypothetical protein